MKRKFLSTLTIVMFALSTTVCAQLNVQEQTDRVVASTEDIHFYTSEWEGERYEDGRPRVSQDLIDRLGNLKVEDVWQFLNESGYTNQFEGDWKAIFDDRPIVGRVLTAQFSPSRPDIEERLTEQGLDAGHIGPMNSWPIDMLQEGDVYVADNFGKIEQGTLIGGNLGNSIYSKSQRGVIFDGSIRDVEELKRIDGFNALSRGWSPTFLEDVMLAGINVPIQIGDVTVFPGDVVLAKEIGAVFVPPHMVEEVVVTAEIVSLRDAFAQQRVREGAYTTGQVDQRWSEEMEEDFLEWIQADSRSDRLPVPIEEMQEYLQQRTW
ncbi:MAG: RraA family protein [Bacteroidota bacterium]